MVGITKNHMHLSSMESAANVDPLSSQAPLSVKWRPTPIMHLCAPTFSSSTMSPVDRDRNGISLNNIIDRARSEWLTHDNRTPLTDLY